MTKEERNQIVKLLSEASNKLDDARYIHANTDDLTIMSDDFYDIDNGE